MWPRNESLHHGTGTASSRLFTATASLLRSMLDYAGEYRLHMFRNHCAASGYQGPGASRTQKTYGCARRQSRIYSRRAARMGHQRLDVVEQRRSDMDFENALLQLAQLVGHDDGGQGIHQFAAVDAVQ